MIFETDDEMDANLTWLRIELGFKNNGDVILHALALLKFIADNSRKGNDTLCHHGDDGKLTVHKHTKD